MGATESKKAFARAVELWNAHDPRYFDAYAKDVVTHGFPPPVTPDFDGMKSMFEGMWEAFPDIRVATLQLFADGDLVAFHGRMSGTHEGEFLGAQPTGKTIEFEAMSIARYRDGTIAERWTRLDEIAFMTQLGLMPEPAIA